MDFDRMPNEIRLKIFMQLPFKERVRSARVSKRFQQMSTMAVSQTRVFDMGADVFKNADAKSMRRLVRLFAGNLRQVVQGRKTRIEMLSQRPCPRLEKLDLGDANIRNVTLRNLLINSPSLRSLKFPYPFASVGTFPSGVVCEKMERVDIQRCGADFFESLAQSCPNLKHVALGFDSLTQPKRREQLLNDFFASKPWLETLELTDFMRIELLGNLWSLAELRSLSLNCREISDETMIQISKSFGQLERLQLEDDFRGMVTSRRGIGALSNLKYLRELWILGSSFGSYEIEIDRGAWYLAECWRLQVVHFSYPLSPSTMRAFVQRCPMLRRLTVLDVEEVHTSAAAEEFIDSLSGFVQEHLEIALDWAFSIAGRARK